MCFFFLFFSAGWGGAGPGPAREAKTLGGAWAQNEFMFPFTLFCLFASIYFSGLGGLGWEDLGRAWGDALEHLTYISLGIIRMLCKPVWGIFSAVGWVYGMVPPLERLLTLAVPPSNGRGSWNCCCMASKHLSLNTNKKDSAQGLLRQGHTTGPATGTGPARGPSPGPKTGK